MKTGTKFKVGDRVKMPKNEVILPKSSLWSTYEDENILWVYGTVITVLSEPGHCDIVVELDLHERYVNDTYCFTVANLDIYFDEKEVKKIKRHVNDRKINNVLVWFDEQDEENGVLKVSEMENIILTINQELWN